MSDFELPGTFRMKRLSDRDCRIIALHRSGLGPRQISKEIGTISESRVSKIVQRHKRDRERIHRIRKYRKHVGRNRAARKIVEGYKENGFDISARILQENHQIDRNLIRSFREIFNESFRAAQSEGKGMPGSGDMAMLAAIIAFFDTMPDGVAERYEHGHDVSTFFEGIAKQRAFADRHQLPRKR